VIPFILILKLNNSYRDLLVEVEVDTVVETLLDTLELAEVDVEVLVLALEYVE